MIHTVLRGARLAEIVPAHHAVLLDALPAVAAAGAEPALQFSQQSLGTRLIDLFPRQQLVASGAGARLLPVALSLLLTEQQETVQTEGVSGPMFSRAGAADQLIAAGSLFQLLYECYVLRQEVVRGVLLEQGALPTDRDGTAGQMAGLRVRAFGNTIPAQGVEAVEENKTGFGVQGASGALPLCLQEAAGGEGGQGVHHLSSTN